MILTREEILSSPEYWFEEAQNELYAQVVTYMEREGLNQNQLAEKLNVTKGYVSQILKGEFNYTLKKLIEISLAIGRVPKINYITVAKVIAEDRKAAANNWKQNTKRKNQKPVHASGPLKNSKILHP